MPPPPPPNNFPNYISRIFYDGLLCGGHCIAVFVNGMRYAALFLGCQNERIHRIYLIKILMALSPKD